jgi:hypothetical protein
MRSTAWDWFNRLSAHDQHWNLAMGQDLVHFAAENEARQPPAAMRGHADKIAFFLLGDGNDLLIDIVTLDKRGVKPNPGGACEILYQGEELSGVGLLLPHVRFGQDFSFAGP